MAQTVTDVKKEVKYINKDFSQFRKQLVDFAKIYYPNSYNDFNESSPGMMFIEMAAYVGDVLSFYIDSQFKEMLLAYAEERKNIIGLAKTFGYTTKPIVPANTILDIYQTVPTIKIGENHFPDTGSYGLILKEGLEVQSTTDPSITFRTSEDISFKYSSDRDPMEVTVYETDADGCDPTKWLLKKQVKAAAGTLREETFDFTIPEKFSKVTLSSDKVTEIISVVDSDGNTWYEVPYLAQDTLFQDFENSAENDPELSQYDDTAPFILRLKKTSRRFVRNVTSKNMTELRFGSGVSSNPDEDIIPNPENVGSNLPGAASKIDFSYDPANFLYTRTYGLVPSDTTLTVKYYEGGGLHTNVAQGDLTTITNVSYVEPADTGLNAATMRDAKRSLAVINNIAGTGGKNEETIEEIRQNALAHFSTQNRAVTKEDYIVRCYSLPAKYGNIAKVYVVQDEQLNVADNMIVTSNSKEKVGAGERKGTPPPKPDKFIDNVEAASNTKIPNPLALNFYTLGYDGSGKLTKLNKAVKQNLKTYLSQYRMLTDALNIKDGYVVNIGVTFDVLVLKNYNKREVVLKCINKLKEYFTVNNWQINQPIILSEVIYQMSLVDGVQNIIDIQIENKFDSTLGYSGNVYNIEQATRDGIIYPSVDPSIFEIKFPDKDIQGRAV